MKLLIKDCLKKIKNTFGRFLSIFVIVALGTGFFIGIKSVSYDMLLTMDDYFDKNNLMDLKIVSTNGITDGMIKELEKIDDLKVYPAYSEDIIYNEKVVRVHSLEEVNKVNLIGGSYPKNDFEVLAPDDSYKIGDTIDVDSSKVLKQGTYKVVGIIKSPLYIGKDKGVANIGDGKLESYLYTLKENFNTNYYTEVYITKNDLKDLNTYKNDYSDKIEDLKDEINTKKLSKINMDDIKKAYNVPDLKLLNIEDSKIYVFDRTDNEGYSDYKTDTERIDSIATVFPVFFVLVAALVCLNTMVRFIEEEREEIGTFKSLGFSNLKIIFIYLLYGFIASALGVLVGLNIGYYVFPNMVYDIFKFNYILPKLIIYREIGTSIIVSIVFIILIILVTIYSCYNSLKEEPSNLLRPKSPEVGKKVILEKIPFIWNKLNFTNKVTARNIFRYKKRIFMMIIGVGGSTALLLTGLGLKDSISKVVDKQYKEIFKYDSILVLNENVKEINDNIANTLKDNKINDYGLFKMENYIFKKDNKKNNFTLLMSQDNIEKYIDIDSKLSDDGVIITNKMASLLNVKVGDSFSFENANGDKFKVKVSYITENYVGHYMYINKTYYEKVIGNLNYNSIISKSKINNKEKILENDNFINVTMQKDVVEKFDTMLESLNKIIFIIILSASTLAFVVLYNLTIINVIERKREIATLKVLGFHDKEVSSYIYKETIALTFLGSLIGLVLGVLLHMFVMKNTEMDEIIFPRIINISSYIISIILIMLFNLIIGVFIHFRLKRIDMISSLKSVE